MRDFKINLIVNDIPRSVYGAPLQKNISLLSFANM